MTTGYHDVYVPDAVVVVLLQAAKASQAELIAATHRISVVEVDVVSKYHYCSIVCVHCTEYQ